ncbi:MAG: hypothetical protein ACI9BF_000473 [Candidatus Paceibacteria bacterium]|jgi:hypothetical protein
MNEKPKFEVAEEKFCQPELKMDKSELIPVERGAKNDSEVRLRPDNLTSESVPSFYELPPEYVEPVGEQREKLRSVLSDIGIMVLPKKE